MPKLTIRILCSWYPLRSALVIAPKESTRGSRPFFPVKSLIAREARLRSHGSRWVLTERPRRLSQSIRYFFADMGDRQSARRTVTPEMNSAGTGRVSGMPVEAAFDFAQVLKVE